MAFELDSVVPWGRNLEEYKLMFRLDDSDMSKKIAGFGDGPACFNCEMTNIGAHVVSFDPIYQFSKEEIEKRIEEVRVIVMQQMKENMDNYVWTHIKDLDANKTDLTRDVIDYFQKDYNISITTTDYEFQKGDNKLLIIRK